MLSPGAHCLRGIIVLGHVVSGADCLRGVLSPGADCLWGKLSLGGADSLRGIMSLGQNVSGHIVSRVAHYFLADCLWAIVFLVLNLWVLPPVTGKNKVRSQSLGPSQEQEFDQTENMIKLVGNNFV